jgi:hypothetical protein
VEVRQAHGWKNVGLLQETVTKDPKMKSTVTRDNMIECNTMQAREIGRPAYLVFLPTLERASYSSSSSLATLLL